MPGNTMNATLSNTVNAAPETGVPYVVVNVLVALADLPGGERVVHSGETYTLKTTIPAKHKFAMKDFPEGSEIVMYGVTVGRSREPIVRGGLLTTLGSQIAFAEGRCVGGGTEINSAIFQRTPGSVLSQWSAAHGIGDFNLAHLLTYQISLGFSSEKFNFSSLAPVRCKLSFAATI